ncbi:DUF2189 domain-containing protein [Devosia neptuniae]|jgi:uncharacterized membrane protein|uniref:DUF2189 domain-containing protein n=1 Tax=Devosia TaxID=46913 RepID=UPI0022AFCCEC|nr:DUF2189 domain-containing protein [Devosia neptuniae]MCZ4347476.1 DUF2189 domain-containing protein [Devosia neptuniae]|tara:strand:+ start:69516 stop:70328 length:813 start_codon:yes stop_codon:yes gene_type:complete
MAHFHVISGTGDKLDLPVIRRISIADLGDALRLGLADFWDKPSHYAMLAIIYPIVGIVLTVWMNGYHTWPLLYPLVGGFALIGPFAALGLYEISRRREQGLDASWGHAFDVLKSPAIGSIAAVGVMLLVLFTLWLTAAQALYESLFGASTPQTLDGLLAQIFTEPGGTTLLIVGTMLGALFALATLCTSVIAFPLMLDRDVGAFVAVETSFRAVLKNPLPMLAWGALVGAGLFIGTIPLFVGLAIIIPIFGHATWHLYRKLIDNASLIRQ